MSVLVNTTQQKGKGTSKNYYFQGFTLIELLVVIGILAVLLAITLIAINPARQFSQANNTKRAADVNAILNAVHQYAADNQGTLPSGITTSLQYISSSTVGRAFCEAIVPQYIAALPTDPTAQGGVNITSCTTPDWETGYQIRQIAGGRITVSAPHAELGENIQFTR